MDTMTPKQRSERMALVRSKNTALEVRVRRLVHGLGYRYRLHRKDLPGKPDMVFASHGAVIFVHGCFWHRHEGCKLARLPESKLDFRRPKLEANKARDACHLEKLGQLGWRALVVWECELTNTAEIQNKVTKFLKSGDA